MREPIWLCQKCFNGGVIPLPLIKTYIVFLLTTVDYLHTGCGVVHTGVHSSPKNWFIRAVSGLQLIL